jgi:hypothetical protein
MPASTARIVLTNGTLRWSSPTLFNDPFDVPREMAFGISQDQFIEAGVNRIAEIIESPPEDTSNLYGKLKLIAEIAKRGIPGQVKEEMLRELRGMAATFRPEIESIEELRSLWRALIPEYRILCLTESPSHMAMWYHYADGYRGAVLEFRCIDEFDSPWLVARPVTYMVEKPEIYTAEGWGRLMTSSVDFAVNQMMEIAAYTKAADWSYEKEWRIATFKREGDVGDYTDYPFEPRELASIYLGPLMPEEDQRGLIELAAKYPSASVIKVSVAMNRELQFCHVTP